MPETVTTYAVGAYVDPEDEGVRHEPHLIQRLEHSARWNLAPAAAEAAPVPSAPPPVSSITPPEPIVTPLSAVPPTLPPKNPEVPAVGAVPPPPAPDAPLPPVAIATPGPTDSEPVLMPNADGVIDLAAVDSSADSDEANPFTVRSLPADAIRELSLRIGGVLSGNQPGALVNDRPVMVGDAIESLTLVRVELDAAVFRAGTRLLRLPVSAQAIRVRLAP